MAKDRSKRAWSINRAQSKAYPARPKPVPRKGSYHHSRYDNFLGIAQREVKAIDELAEGRDRLFFYSPNRIAPFKGHKQTMKAAKRYRAP